jgi:DNA-binding response OmpR family regulator
MLTALDSVEDRVAGLRAGADDYLGKPFAFEELLARIEANLRRGVRRAPTTVLDVGDLHVDLRSTVVTCRGKMVSLTLREYELLVDLARHPGELRTRDEIHRDVWGNDFDRGTNLINVYITYVRAKLKEAGSEVVITTIRGKGYRMDPEPVAPETS